MYNPTPETRTPLQPKDSEFYYSKVFLRYTASITLLSKIISPNALPKASIYTLGNIAVSNAEVVEMVND